MDELELEGGTGNAPRRGKGGAGFTHEAPVDGATVEWFTPAWIFEELRLEFDLDPCAPKGGLPWIPAKRFISLPENGLDAPWEGRVWLNPPYGRDTKKWFAKMHEHRNGVALVFARTSAKWFHRYAATATGILFLNRRVPFVDHTGQPPLRKNPRTGKMEKSGPGADSMLVAWGEENFRALENAEHLGFVISCKDAGPEMGAL